MPNRLRAPRSTTKRKRKVTTTENKKVRNARKYDEDGVLIKDYKYWKEKNPNGIALDSKLEYMCWKTLTDNKVEFELKRKYTIIPAFEYLGEKVRPITWTPDFYLTKYDYILETKGYANDGFGNKLKTMKYHLFKENSKTRIAICKTQAEVLNFLMELTRGFKD